MTAFFARPVLKEEADHEKRCHQTSPRKRPKTAFAEKADMIVQIMGIGQTITPNGAPLITAEEMQQGILDVLDDNGDLSVVENIFKTYEDYQTQITQLKGQIAQQQQQQAIDNTNSQEQALIDQMQQGVQNMNQQAVEEQDLNNILSSIGL